MGPLVHFPDSLSGSGCKSGGGVKQINPIRWNWFDPIKCQQFSYVHNAHCTSHIVHFKCKSQTMRHVSAAQHCFSILEMDSLACEQRLTIVLSQNFL